MVKGRRYKRLSPIELLPSDSSEFEKQIEEAEKEFGEIRINFRWGKEQLNLVKHVAGLMGVPYQTYIKQTLYRSCLSDLKAFSEGKRCIS